MASSIASSITLNKSRAGLVAVDIPFNSKNNPRQHTSVDKIGGILCCICTLKFGKKQDFERHFASHNAGEVVFTCVACNKPHSSYASFRNHCYLQHIVRDKFGCQFCNKRFSRQSSLSAHITAIHEFKCGDCDEIFTTKRDLHMHKITHNKKGKDAPPYSCETCSEAIISIVDCENHMDTHCEITYPCPICGKILPSQHEAHVHLGVHFDEEFIPDTEETAPYCKEDSSIDTLGGILCCHCDLLFKNRSELVSHFSSDHEEKNIVYSCNVCDKQFISYTLFGDHCYRHISKGSFECDQCENIFPRLSLLVKHNLAFHSLGASDKPYQCDKCEFAFKSYYRLVEHKRLVHEEASIKCNLKGCSVVLNSCKELIEHLRAHTSCLDNWCRSCGLQFATRAACAAHLPVHRRKRYACPVCARAYAERYLLLKHLPRHFEAVLHICKVCGRSYDKRSRLVEHSKIHSDIKNKYKCSNCTKAFVKAYQLEQHQRIHTGVKPYTCADCLRTFASYPNWTKHLTRAHSYTKEMIKQAREKGKRTEKSTPQLSPAKTESGIESAGSELSDVYGFIESDDSESYSPIKNTKQVYNHANNIKDAPTVASITDTVNAVIERIDSMDDLDMIAKELVNFTDYKTTQHSGELESDFTNYNNGVKIGSEFNDYNDSSDIRAIVEQIDALSGGLEMEATSQAPEASEMLQFTEMQPVENIAFDSAYSTPLLEPSIGYQSHSVPLEYGPDFSTLGSETFPEVMDLNDHVLPHIDPLLTIKAQKNKVFVQNPIVNAFEQDWEQPIISKLLSYDNANDVNRMFELNGNLF